MESFLGSVAWRALTWLPKFILRKIFNPQWLADHIHIQVLPEQGSVTVFASEQPSLQIYFELRNNTHFDVTIDRILIEFFCGSKYADIAYLKKTRLKAGAEQRLYIDAPIDYYSYQKIYFNLKHNISHARFSIWMECDSKPHSFTKRKDLERVNIHIANEHLLPGYEEEKNTSS